MIKNKLKLLLLKVFVVTAYLSYKLIANIYGVLVLSLILYYSFSLFGVSQPFTAFELLIWVDQLSEAQKTAIFSSLLTIVGFLIAFSLGSAQQKQQFTSQMKIELASEVESFFNEASRLLTDVDIYAKRLLSSAREIEEGKDQAHIDFLLDFVADETTRYREARDRLSHMSVDIHRFSGKYSLTLASTWGATDKLKQATSAFGRIVHLMWFPVPIVDSDKQDTAVFFTKYICIEKCQLFIDEYKGSFSLMNGITGGLTGGLIGSITSLNLPLIVNFLKIKACDIPTK